MTRARQIRGSRNLRSGDNWPNRLHIQMTSRRRDVYCKLIPSCKLFSPSLPIFIHRRDYTRAHTHIRARMHAHTDTHILRNLCFAENSNFNYEYLFAIRFSSFFRAFLSPKHLLFSFRAHTRARWRTWNYFCHPFALCRDEVFRRSRKNTDSRNPALSASDELRRTITETRGIMDSRIFWEQFSDHCWTHGPDNTDDG